MAIVGVVGVWDAFGASEARLWGCVVIREAFTATSTAPFLDSSTQ